MIYFRVLIFIIAMLLVVYYTTVVAHILGFNNITNQRITLIKCIIPFYFWLTD